MIVATGRASTASSIKPVGADVQPRMLDSSLFLGIPSG
jgi:hypothetical protein